MTSLRRAWDTLRTMQTGRYLRKIPRGGGAGAAPSLSQFIVLQRLGVPACLLDQHRKPQTGSIGGG
jgi:hypothetical protein